MNATLGQDWTLTGDRLGTPGGVEMGLDTVASQRQMDNIKSGPPNGGCLVLVSVSDRASNVSEAKNLPTITYSLKEHRATKTLPAVVHLLAYKVSANKYSHFHSHLIFFPWLLSKDLGHHPKPDDSQTQIIRPTYQTSRYPGTWCRTPWGRFASPTRTWPSAWAWWSSTSPNAQPPSFYGHIFISWSFWPHSRPFLKSKTVKILSCGDC